MFMHRQTDGHACTCIDGKLQDSLFKTCIIMYRDNVRNRHLRACRGIHARVIILKFPMKMNELVPSSPTCFIFIGYLKRGAWRGLCEPRETQTGSATAYTCMLMHRHSSCIIHEHATRMYFKKYIWAELSYEFGPSCLINMGRVGMGRVGFGRVVRNSYIEIEKCVK